MSRPSSSSSISCDQRGCARQRVRDHFERHLHAERRQPAPRSLRCFARPRPVGCRPTALGQHRRHRRRASPDTETESASPPRVPRALRRRPALRRASVAGGIRKRADPLSASSASKIGACIECSSSLVSDSHSASCSTAPFVRVVEVRARREHLDGVESVRGDVDEMLARQPCSWKRCVETPKRRSVTRWVLQAGPWLLQHGADDQTAILAEAYLAGAARLHQVCEPAYAVLSSSRCSASSSRSPPNRG